MNPFPKIEYHWVKCSKCDADIERVRALSNRLFTCYDCKMKRRKQYDNSPKRIQARKDHRIVQRIVTKAEPLNKKEQEALDRFLKRKHRRPGHGSAFRYQYKSST